MPPTDSDSFLAKFRFLDHCNDLFVRKSCLHLSALFEGRTLHKFGGILGAQVN
jgi:hypothetical protein